MKTSTAISTTEQQKISTICLEVAKQLEIPKDEIVKIIEDKDKSFRHVLRQQITKDIEEMQKSISFCILYIANTYTSANVFLDTYRRPYVMRLTCPT